MSEVVHETGRPPEAVETVDLGELAIGDRVIVTTRNSVYDFEIADGSQHSIRGDESTDLLTIRAYTDRATGQDRRLTHGQHYRSPHIILLGSRPLGRKVHTIDDLDHHTIQCGTSFLVHMDGEEADGQHKDRFEFSTVEAIELLRQAG